MSELKNGQIIFYDGDEMKCYNINVYNSNQVYYEPSRKDFFEGTYSIPYSTSIDFEIDPNPIELDPTTMLRIAKYNKRVELDSVNKLIEKKKEKLKNLEWIENKLDNLLLFVKEYMGNDEYGDIKSFVTRNDADDFDDDYYEED